MVSESDDADVKIVDFGFAAIAHGETLTAQCGTPGYIAPEILFGRPHGASRRCNRSVLTIIFLTCAVHFQALLWICGPLE